MQPGLQINLNQGGAGDGKQTTAGQPPRRYFDVVTCRTPIRRPYGIAGYQPRVRADLGATGADWMMGVRSALTVGIALPLSAAMVLIGMMYRTFLCTKCPSGLSFLWGINR